MLKVGLTGNMGSGKSTVASVFRCLDIPVYHADEAAKRIYLRSEILRQVVALAGNSILDTEGNLDRRALAQQVFADPDMLNQLNMMIHPQVCDDFAEWIEDHKASPYVIHEAAILFESGYRNEFDLVIHVSCPEDIAIGRIGKRDGLSRSEIRQRIRLQIPDAEKAARSDFIIRNDGSELVIPQVLRIHSAILERSA